MLQVDFGEWGNIFNDEIMAATIIDGLIHNSVIKSFAGPSYRLLNHIRGKSVLSSITYP
ncbi:MAG: ATP-binding protein [Senegalia sp. (in: firmicutes)]|uniref:ATP-binding protein n=1 Tax=Senegalia sp. (in: firmicutes) TaxID=1924098 RepID=UPI003F9BB0B9